jgi:hypothetical protein
MRKPCTIPAALLAVVAFTVNGPAFAVELLSNGMLESSASPPSWNLTSSITGHPELNISATEQVSFANEPAPAPQELGLLLRPFAGNAGDYADQNYPVNVVLSQSVAGSPNRTYTLTGHSFLASGYSGSVDVMDALSPSDPLSTGTVPSPTQTKFELAFLDASNNVLGTPVTVDLKTSDLTRDAWRTSAIMGMSPAGTAKVRVTASALDMLENFGFQDVYFDNFLLQRDGDASNVNRLLNGNLNTVGAPSGFEITQAPEDMTETTIGFRDFANHTTGGQQGLWLRSFIGGDGFLNQTVPGVAGGNYTFSAWSKWEAGYSGDKETWGAGAFPTQTLISMSFLDTGGNVIGSPISLELDAAGQNNDATWREYSVNGVAPTGTASVKISAGATGMKKTTTDPQSAFFDDFSLTGPAAGLPGDVDGNGKVDGHDFLLIQRGLGSTYTSADVAAWKANFGTPAAQAASAVPEPAALAAAMVGLLGVASARRRRT